jgi:hypothetical protein
MDKATKLLLAEIALGLLLGCPPLLFSSSGWRRHKDIPAGKSCVSGINCRPTRTRRERLTVSSTDQRHNPTSGRARSASARPRGRRSASRLAVKRSEDWGSGSQLGL